MAKKKNAKKKPPKKIESGLSGVAGEYFVAGELSRLGYLAALTLKNTRGIDILVSNSNASKAATIQVKTNQGQANHWVLTNKADDFHSPRHFYVFVNLSTKTGLPEYYIYPSKTVADYTKNNHQSWLNTPGKHGQARKDSTLRKFNLDGKKHLNRWDLLELD
jgi:hypothetical protein